MATMTVRERIAEIQRELLRGDVLPSRLREMLMEVTSLYGNCVMEANRTETAYTEVLAQCLDAEETANRAKIRAALSPESKAWRDAKVATKVAYELILSLKTVLKSADTEMSLSR
jgi:hypothetical protein